jgi:hypothetical protein
VLATAGVAHGLRTGEDIAGAGVPYTFNWVKNAMRNVAFRFFVNRFLVSDADTALVRGLPPGEQRLQLTASLMAGRLYGLGDDLPSLSTADTELLAKAASMPWPARDADVNASEGFVPLDYGVKPQTVAMNKLELFANPGGYHVPSVWRLTLADGGALVALLNWSDGERAFSLSLAELALPKAKAATELWTEGEVALTGGKLEQAVSPHSAALLRLR